MAALVVLAVAVAALERHRVELGTRRQHLRHKEITEEQVAEQAAVAAVEQVQLVEMLLQILLEMVVLELHQLLVVHQ